MYTYLHYYVWIYHVIGAVAFWIISILLKLFRENEDNSEELLTLL